MNNQLLSPTVLLAIYCGLVILASLAGGWALLMMRLSHARLQIAVSLVAGLMLGVALLHFIPHAIEENHSVERTVQYVLAGFLVMFFLQRFFPHHSHDVPEIEESDHAAHEHSHDEVHAHDHHDDHGHHHEHAEGSLKSSGRLSWVATTVGMSFHSLLGGVALAAAVSARSGHLGMTVGLGTALVIILHKPFDAITVTTLMSVSGASRSSRHVLNVLFSLVTPLGALLFYIGANRFFGANAAFIGSALAFCAGTFLCIACADLLPELQFHSHDRFKLSFALAIGLSIAILIGMLEPSEHEEHTELRSIPSSGQPG